MKQKGKSKDQAIQRTIVNKKYQTYAHKRLLKDLEEIQNEKIPTVGVTARPLENNLFIWHANLKGPEGTLYQGGVFHIQMKFPLSFPHHPPTITIFNKIPHPNVFDTYICLDMIKQEGKREQGQGWSSAYTVQSILTQLQSFLFEENLSANKQTVELETKKALKQANSFKCRDCKHGGKLSCWPQFSSKQVLKDEFKILETESDIIKKELVCYHTKNPFNLNQLGLGLKVSKIPRTGNIREAQTFQDYISIKAFIKQSVNKTSMNERITHWLPVYFGKLDNQQRFFKFLTKALSMIMTNSTRNFKKQFILEVLPKLMITIIYYMMDEKRHASIRYIRLLCHIHSIFLYCLKRFPELKDSISSNISKFIKSEEARTKQNQSNLGSILATLSVIDSHKFSEVAPAYFAEQLDRQVLWIIKAVPDILDEKIKEDVDKERPKLVFKSQMTSFHIFCFYKLFIGEICEKRASRASLLDQYEDNFCKLSNKEQQYFQSKIIQIQKNINSFSQFFKYIGLKQMDEKQIGQMLKQAIKNSERKKYHGQLQIIHEVPNSQEQFSKILSVMPTYKTYFDIKEIIVENNKRKEVKYEIHEKESTEDDWKRMCIERWSWIKEAINYEKQLTSSNINEKAIDFIKNGIQKTEQRLIKIINDYKNKGIDYKLPKIQIPKITWKQLFLRLDLEDFLIYIDMNPDFNSFYEKLEVCRVSKVNTLVIPIVPVKQVKSGYYYLTSLLTRLNTLKYLQFTGLPQKNTLCDKSAKAIEKGLKNFIQEGGVLEIFSIHNILASKDFSESIFTYISNSDKLFSLRFQNTNVFIHGNAMKIISKCLVQLKDIQELVFNECQLNEEKCKNLADVLMRAKKLRIFQIHNSQNLANGLSSLIYNLSFFSPNLEMLDISRCQSNVTETIVSLYKMLKITTSVQVLLARNVNGLNPNLVDQFWISLGECRTLRVLDLGYSGDLTYKGAIIGNAIGFNAKKKGILQYIDFTNCANNSNFINSLYQGMCLSEYDQQRIYGDPTKAAKMISSNYQKTYYNHLKALQLNKCGNLNFSFNLSYWNKLHYREDPDFVKLLARSPSLVNCSFSLNSLRKDFAEILSLALDPSRANFKGNNLKVLDLSKNQIDKQGIKALTNILPKNQILEVLDLSKNQLGVPGASELSIALKGNTSLKFLNLFNNKIGFDGAKALAVNVIQTHPKLQCIELGHNRIRDKGLKQLTDAIISNKASNLKILGLRFNYITNIGATYLYNKLTSSKTKIEELYLRNNLIDDVAVNNLQQIKEHEKSLISIDILDKLKYLDPEKLERTIWIHPIENINLQNLKQFFEITHKCGIVLDARVKRARKYPNKRGNNLFGFIQFADSNSVNRALHLASKKLTFVDGVKFRIYKAGTGTFIFAKKTAKQKKLEQAHNELPRTPYDMPSENLNMRRPMRPTIRQPNQRPPQRDRGGRGGRGGRGRGTDRRQERR